MRAQQTSTQHAARSTQHAARSTQHAARSTQHAALSHEQAKITTLLDAGHGIDDVLSGASRERVLALIDMAETLPNVLGSNDATAIVTELRDSAADRLAELGIEPIVQARHATVSAPSAAWDQVIAETAEGGASIESWQNVYRHDADGYAAAGGVL